MSRCFHYVCPFKRALQKSTVSIIFPLVSLFFSAHSVNAQQPASHAGKGASIKFAKGANADLFGTQKSFIKNIGQYGKTMTGYEDMGAVKYGYEGLGMPVLLTSKGLIHLQRKVEKISHEEEERLERQGVKEEEEIERKKNITDRVITMEWINANPDVKIIAEEKETAYHTYGMLPDKAYGYKKIIYKNMYPGIDVVYSFTQNKKPGFEYSLLVQPGADLTAVKLQYGGDVKTIKTDTKGNLVIQSDIDGVSSSAPVNYYGERLVNKTVSEVKAEYKIENNQISFSFPNGYDNTKAFVIDPFVSSSTVTLTGANAGKAIDVDYDYAGNIYVAGGGNVVSTFAAGASHKHAKYSSTGALLWTFTGILTIPAWQADFYYGGWVVDKATGNVYIGQGFAINGFRVIRLSTTGLYDNYISTGNPAFQEAWKMYWVCNNGQPQIICAGGGTTGPTNFAYCTPPSTILSAAVNLTGSPVAGQDMTDLVVDPVTNSLYTIYASPLDANTANKIFKHNQPYSAATTAWSTFTGYPNTILELRNRPYLAPTYSDNSSNILALNPTYIFYWDGLRLKAFNKTTGAVAGAPLTLTGNTALMQGGIVADACNNVFIGNTNGVIKVYNFNGATFDDAAAPDISIAGYNTAALYDLALDESKKLLYASGNGFVSSIDVSAYCPTTQYIVNVVPNCVMASATATVSPAPPPNSTITYALFIGTTQIGNTNTTGTFTGLNPNVTYTIIATINFACSGVQATANFILPGPTITFTQTNTTCGASTGSINATGSGIPGPYSYSLNGGAFQPGGSFTGLAGGVYTLVVQSPGGCTNDTLITILNSNGPTLTFTQTNATCGNNAGTVTADVTGGTPPYQYSINGGTTFQAGNFFTGLVAGQYTLVVKDAANCTNSAIINITSSPAVLLTAIPASATCGQNNGTITAFGSGGTAPLQYSINGNTFQAGTLFTGLAPGAYTVTVKDAIGCITTASVTVGNFPPPTVTATATSAACGNINGRITATGSGGIAPYQYSINGGTNYQTSNVFTGLAQGIYTITIKDNTGCTNTVTVTVASTNGPVVTAITTPSSCGASSGSITVTGTGGGGAPYQYSINGINFVTSNLFTGLPAGNYVVYVKDAAQCIGTFTVTVAASTGQLITAVATASSCTANTGTITATGTGGTASLAYSIDGVNYQASNVFNNLPPGIYTVYVRDANNCVKTTTVTVANASGLALSVATINASCAINGIITATATGGVAPLQYSLDGATYQASNVFNGLAPGTYTVYVRDANNCTITKQAVVGSSGALSLTATVPIQATCASNNAVIVASGLGGSAPLTYSINGTIYQASGTFINVAPGAYTVYVKDAAGCIATTTVTVTTSGTGPGISTFTVRTEAAYPCNDNVGKIDQFRVNGANCATCMYSINFGAYLIGNEPIWSNLTPGTYAITARDANGCTRTVLATIGIATLATATATVTPSACGVPTGSITLTGVGGGGATYHANINGGLFIDFTTTLTFSPLLPGTYTIVIADDEDYNDPNTPGNCTTTFQVVVPSTGGPSIATTPINPTCNSNNGSITAIGSGGTAPYTYSINGGAFIGSGVFNNLPAGTHIIRVRDNTGCINLTSVILTGTAVPAVTAIVLDASCNENNGSVTATGTGGTAPLEYSLNGTVFQPSNIFTGLTAGPYRLYVKDANNCFSFIPITITNTPRVQLTAYTIAATCGNNDGSIVATGSQGTPPFTFSIDGTVYQSSGRFTGLAAGFYTVYVKDNRECITTTGVNVSNASAPTIATTSTSATCGNATGSITVTSTGGTAPLEYSKDGINFQPGNSFTGLLPGNYVITVRDAGGCINTRQVLVANINGPHTLTAVIVNAACGNANGTITATATGGTGALQYSINGTTYQASPVFNAVAAGTYTLYVQDVNLCLRPLPVTVLNLPGPIVTESTSPSSCGSNDGTITVNATGGTLPLSYSRDGGATFVLNNNIFTGLATGGYSIVVRDAKNCLSTPVNAVVATIGSSVTPTFNLIGPLCQNSVPPALPLTSTNGINGTWSPAVINTTAIGTATYTFTPTAGQCATTATLIITVNPNVTPTFTPVPAICSGGTLTALPTISINNITGTWSPALNNTATTTYTFTPTAGQCATTATLTITVNPIISPTINCGVSTTSSVTFNWAAVTGATGYTVSYQINANPIVNVGPIGNVLTYSVTGLSGGDNVTITVTPTGGAGTCFTSANATCTATACTPPTANISYAGPFCVNIIALQAVTLTGTGTFTGGVYSSSTGLSINAATGAITPSTSTPGIYTVTYTVAPAGGCPGVTATAPVTITAKPAAILIYHN